MSDPVTPDAGNQKDDTLTDAERVEMMWNLSKAARERFNSRNEVEWKVCFGTWTGFSIASGFTISATSWQPHPVAVVFTVLIVAVIVGIFIWWTCVRRSFDELDSQTSYYWESAIENIMDKKLNPKLMPGDGTWIRFDDDATKAKPKFNFKHPGLFGQIAVTVCLGIGLIVAVGVAAGRAIPGRMPANVEIRGDVEMEKVRIGPNRRKGSQE